jgi:predicted MFS family arabinose efflux permease
VSVVPRFRWTADAFRLAICYCAFGIGYIIPATFLPVMAKGMLSDPTLFRWTWPIFGAAAMVATVVAGRWRLQMSDRRLWQICHIVMAVGVVLPLFPFGFAGIALGALLIGGGFMVTTMAALGAARTLAGADAEHFIAAMTAAFAVGQIVGPLLVSAMVGASGSFAPVLIAASALLVLSAAELAAVRSVSLGDRS